MNSAYYANKIPMYLEDIKNGKREVATLYAIRNQFRKDIADYNIKIFCAHNSRFDVNAVNITQRYLTKSKYRYFFPYGVEIWDTLKMARQTLKANERYENFCYENQFLTKQGRRRYTAEIIYRFLTNNLQFVESHTGLEDVLIEKEIFSFCIGEMPEIDGALWQD